MKLKTTYWMLLLTIIFTLAFAYGWEIWVVMKIQEYEATLLDFHPRRYMAVGPILFSFVFFVIDIILALVFLEKRYGHGGAGSQFRYGVLHLFIWVYFVQWVMSLFLSLMVGEIRFLLRFIVCKFLLLS